VEERRHTEITDASKFDPTRWMPLAKNMPRGQQSATKRPSKDERQESIDESTAVGGDKRRSVAKPTSTIPTENQSSKIENEIICRPHSSARSHSTDLTPRNTEKHTEQRRNTDCSDSRSIVTRLITFSIQKQEIS